MAATIISQIENQAIDAFLLQFRNQPPDIRCRACIVFFACCPGVVVLVKARDRYDADPACLIAVRNLQARALGGLGFQLDLVSYQCKHVLGCAWCCACRQELQLYDGAAGPPDQIDNVVEPPTHNVHHLTFIALTDRNDPVFRFERTVYGGGAAGNNIEYGDKIVLDLQ